MPFEVFPLSFQEFCNIKKINIDINYAPSKAKLIFSFNEFLYKGGFPEIVLSPNLNNIEILQEYYYVMLYKDLIERYRISNIPALKYFIRRVLANLCKPTSINKIYNEIKSAGITVSKNSLYEFIEYTESIFMFFKLLRFDKSFVKETLTDKKYYFIDNGLYSALHANNSENKGQLFENSIFLWLRTKKYFQRGLHFYKGIKECDFILIDRQKPEEIIQVCFDVSEPETLKREIAGLMEASDYLNCNNLKIITFNSEEEIKIDKKIVKIVPAWKEMLS